jgi:hypothetical protein
MRAGFALRLEVVVAQQRVAGAEARVVGVVNWLLLQHWLLLKLLLGLRSISYWGSVF